MSGSSSWYYVPTRTKTPTCALANSPSIDGETRHQNKTKLFKPQARVVVDFVNELMPYVASQRTPRGRQAMKLCVAFNYSCPLITFRLPLSHGSTTRCKKAWFTSRTPFDVGNAHQDFVARVTSLVEARIIERRR